MTFREIAVQLIFNLKSVSLLAPNHLLLYGLGEEFIGYYWLLFSGIIMFFIS